LNLIRIFEVGTKFKIFLELEKDLKLTPAHWVAQLGPHHSPAKTAQTSRLKWPCGLLSASDWPHTVPGRVALERARARSAPAVCARRTAMVRPAMSQGWVAQPRERPHGEDHRVATSCPDKVSRMSSHRKATTSERGDAHERRDVAR
jgi:hypothetical protein